MTEKRIFKNPIIGDRINFLTLSEETNGEYSLAELELVPGGSNPLHYHNSYSETFTVLKGELTLQVNKEIKTLKQGESFEVPAKTNHRFSNTSTLLASFRIQFKPGHTGMENAIKITYGLATDGLTDKKGIPKKIAHVALIFIMADGNIPGFFSLMTPILKWIANRARKKGIEQQLINKYCN